MNSAAQALRQGWCREWWLLRRRPLDLAMLTWVPLLAVWLIWSLFWAGTPRQLPIAVLDGDHSSLSRQLVRLLAASPGLRVAAAPADAAEAAALLRRGSVEAVLDVPQGFARALHSGRPANLTLLHNAQFATHSGLVQRDVRAAVGALGAGIELRAREQSGQSPPAARAALEPMRSVLVAAHNEGLDYEQFLAPALVPTLLHIFAMTAGAWALGRELRDGSIGTLWGLTHRAAPALLAKLALPWAMLVLIDAAFFAALAAGGWRPAGPLLPVIALHALMFALYLLLGTVLAMATKSLRLALSATGFISAPAFAYAGVAFPLAAMPVVAKAWALALPVTHVLAAQTAVLQVGAPALSALPLAAVMAGVTAGLFALAAALLPRLAAQRGAWGRR